MARMARLELVGEIHHVALRGRQTVFFDEADCVMLLHALSEEAREREASLLAWSLLPDSVHLLVRPREKGALALLMQGLGRRWVPQYNQRHHLTGSPWTGRYYSCPVDSSWELRAMRFVDALACFQGVCERPWEYRWSSCSARVMGTPGAIDVETPRSWWDLGNTPFDRQARYQDFLMKAESGRWLDELRRATRLGRPFGAKGWMDSSGVPRDRVPTGRKPGRPRRPRR